MSDQRLELPDFDKFAVSFDELLQKGARVEVKRCDPKRTKSPVIIDPAKFRELYPWPEIPSPSVHSSVKDIEKPPRPSLYRDKRRLIVFIGLMLAWLFKGFDDTVITTIVPALCRMPVHRLWEVSAGHELAVDGNFGRIDADCGVAYDQPHRETDDLPVVEHLRRFDFFGFGLLSLFSVLLLIGIQLAAQSNEWASAPVIACLATSALVFPCFILQQVKYDDPDNRLLPRGLFNRDVSLLLAFGFFVMFAMYGVYYYLSTYFQTVKGLSSFDAAVSLLAFFLASGVSSIATGVSMMWIPYANITILVASTLALVGTFLLTTMDEYTAPLHAGLLSIVSAVGFGASQTLAIVFSQSWAAKQHQSFIVSVALMVQLFGGTLGLVLGGSVLNTQILYRVEKLDGTLTGDQISAVAMALAMPDRIRDFVPEDLIAPLLNVFASSIQIVFYTCAAATRMFAILQWLEE
ncbi:major facilitator superfamily transporter [Seiridium cupressi]